MLNKEQKIAKNVAKYGWRYEILDAWMSDHAIPAHEKSVFSQLKARTQTFGEKIAKRLSEEYGIQGIFFAKESSPDGGHLLTNLESRALSIFRQLPSDEERKMAIETMRIRVNESSDSRDPAVSKARKSA